MKKYLFIVTRKDGTRDVFKIKADGLVDSILKARDMAIQNGVSILGWFEVTG